MKWLWVCSGDRDANRMCYSVVKCTKNPLVATTTLLNLKRKDSQHDHWVKKDVEHSDRDYKQFKCPECENQMSKRELDDTWDWSGPHCSECGCTGVRMFAAVKRLKPIMSGYQAFIALKGIRKEKERIINNGNTKK